MEEPKGPFKTDVIAPLQRGHIVLAIYSGYSIAPILEIISPACEYSET